MSLFDEFTVKKDIRTGIKIVILFIIGLLIYSLMKQFIYWLSFNETFRVKYKVLTIIILLIVFKFI